LPEDSIEHPAAAAGNISTRDKLAGVLQSHLQDLRVRVHEREYLVQQDVVFLQIDGFGDAEDFRLPLLAFGHEEEPVLLALPFVPGSERTLLRGLHRDFRLHEVRLLIGSRLGFLRVDALVLGKLLLDVRFRELGCKLLTPDRYQKLRRDRRFAETDFANGDARFLRFGSNPAFDFTLDQGTLIDEVEHLARTVYGNENRLAVRI